MVIPAAGEVVLVPFPFSDLSQSKLRPAVCLADAGRGGWASQPSPPRAPSCRKRQLRGTL